MNQDWTKPETCEGCPFAEVHLDVTGCNLLKRAVLGPECTAEDHRSGKLQPTEHHHRKGIWDGSGAALAMIAGRKA